MSFEPIEITPEIVKRINKFLDAKITIAMVPNCFTFPELEEGLCNPGKPLPAPTSEVPKPRICGLFHICTIYMGERLGIENAKDLGHQKLVEMLLKGEVDEGKESSTGEEQENAVRETEESAECSTNKDEGNEETVESVVEEKASEEIETQPEEKISEPEKPKKGGRPKKEKVKTEEVKDVPDKSDVSESDSPFRANSIPHKIWEYLKTGMYSDAEIIEHIKSITGKKADHYIGYVCTKAKELNVLKEEDGKIGIE